MSEPSSQNPNSQQQIENKTTETQITPTKTSSVVTTPNITYKSDYFNTITSEKEPKKLFYQSWIPQNTKLVN